MALTTGEGWWSRSTRCSAPRSSGTESSSAPATNRALDLDPRSKRYPQLQARQEADFAGGRMADAGYQVTKYIYSAPDVTLPMGICRPCSKGRWIGYVAVASDSEAGRLRRRDILVSFRGTVTCSECWLTS
ncbi:Lipase [Hordeum vulgare]|nr:Lipase [Hordeum vulgare]